MTTRDWGSDTLARFRYQAEVTLPFCLAVLSSQENILAVIPEHHEDIALKTTDGYRFLQVKSRDPERGLWTASDLFRKPGGALRSLHRTYLLTRGSNYPLELVLEGAAKPSDPICALHPGEDRSPMVQMVINKFDASPQSAHDFLRRVTLNASAPPRSSVHDTNGRLLHQYSRRSVTFTDVEQIHISLLTEIERAMRCDPISPLWPRYLTQPHTRRPAHEEHLLSKTIDAQRLATITPLLSRTSRPLLTRFVESGSRPVTTLTQKLVVGGATDALVERARALHAAASHNRAVRSSRALSPADHQLTDLRERLLTYARSATALHGESSQPAVGVWDYLLGTFTRSAEQIDRNGVVHADPMLLLGESCILSDECAFDWGTVNDVAQ